VMPKEYITELKDLNTVRRLSARAAAPHGN
jgi:hypothetical protein